MVTRFPFSHFVSLEKQDPGATKIAISALEAQFPCPENVADPNHERAVEELVQSDKNCSASAYMCHVSCLSTKAVTVLRALSL